MCVLEDPRRLARIEFSRFLLIGRPTALTQSIQAGLLVRLLTEGLMAASLRDVVLQLHLPDGTCVIIGAAGQALDTLDLAEAVVVGILCACEFVAQVCKQTCWWACM